jgi:hypothetical protein
VTISSPIGWSIEKPYLDPFRSFFVKGVIHRIRVDPRPADLEAILTSSLDGLPFALQMPTGFAANADEIGHYKASIDPNMFYANPFMKFPVHDAVLSLLFYKDAKTLDTRATKTLDRFVESIPSIIDGQTTLGPSIHRFY